MSADVAVPDSTDYPGAGRAWRVTILLTIVFVFSFVDRQILNLLVGPIQEDLGLNDTQVSLLQGFGFVATYVLLSIPIGRLVDTRRRVSIIACGVAFWSLATAACGMARSFTGLFAARAGVGIGEATLTPAAWSLLADYFPPHRRSLPFSVFLMGPYLGVGIAMIAGGLVMDGLAGRGPLVLPGIGAIAPWQATFFVVAAPGLVLTALLLLVSEPERKGLKGGASPEAASFPDILAWVRTHHRVYVALLVGVPCIVLVLYGLQAWIPTYLLRVHGMSLGEAGTRYGAIALIAGSLGVLSGPFVGRYLERKGHSDYHLRVCVLALALIGPGLAALAFAPSAASSLVCIALVSYLVPLPLALVAAALQSATPNQMRGVLVGTYVVTTNVLGLALGPSMVAVATDYLFRDPAAVGKSLALVGVVVSLFGIFLIGRALAPYRALLAEHGAGD